VKYKVEDTGKFIRGNAEYRIGNTKKFGVKHRTCHNTHYLNVLQKNGHSSIDDHRKVVIRF
jgi:hypothetical protein